MEESCALDRSGSSVLDYLILGRFMQQVERNFENFKEIIITIVWYIWWIRRKKVHGEPVKIFLRVQC
jgi:hypothetical protein